MTRLARSSRFWDTMVLVWFCALFVVSSISRLPPGPNISNFDKFEHTAYYSLGAACFYLARRLKSPSMTAWRVLFWTVVFAMGVGAFDEFHQSFTPGRSGNDVYDWLADTLGGFIGSFFGWIAFRALSTRAKLPVERMS